MLFDYLGIEIGLKMAPILSIRFVHVSIASIDTDNLQNIFPYDNSSKIYTH